MNTEAKIFYMFAQDSESIIEGRELFYKFLAGKKLKWEEIKTFIYLAEGILEPLGFVLWLEFYATACVSEEDYSFEELLESYKVFKNNIIFYPEHIQREAFEIVNLFLNRYPKVAMLREPYPPYNN